MRPKIGIALSGGAVRGISHIGILKALERHSIPVDLIAGTSMGALIGALYASGMSIAEMEQHANTAKWKELIDFTVPKNGLIAGRKIEDYIKKILKKHNFEELQMPLSIIVTDLNTGEKIVFNQGDLIKAIKASIAVPGIFEPIVDDTSILADGGLVDPIPVDVVKGMGADIVIAVDLAVEISKTDLEVSREESAFTKFFEREFISTEISYMKEFLREKKIKLPFFLGTLLSAKRVLNIMTNKEIKIAKYTIRSLDILSHHFAKEKLKYPYIDVIIKPEFEGIKWTEFDKSEQCMKAGEAAAEEAVPKIRRLLERAL